MADAASDSFDLVVIGGGTGGYAAAFRGAQLGLRVALVDKYRIGGTCLHVGCIPTKAMLESADLVDRIKHAGEFGIDVAGHSVDLPRIADRRDGIVEKMTKGLMFLVKKHKVEYIRGVAKLQGATTIKVTTLDDAGEPTGERTLTSKDTILATGSRTKSLPGIVPDGERILTSDHILRSRDVPASLIVVGAGAVGMEFASFYADMGTAVTVLEYLPAVTPLEDVEVSKEMERAFTKRGIKVITNARFDAASVKVDERGVSLMVGKEGETPAELVAEKMLVATGRAANTEDVGLETTKAVVERTLVKVDPATMETAEPHLYAIGDIIGGLWLAHVAAHEGINAVTAITGGEVHALDYVTMPRATYSRPQIASIGRTQQECERDGIPFKVGKVPFQAIGKAVIVGETGGFAKIIAHAETDEILGVHLIGTHVTELIAEASAAMLFESTAWELGAAVHPHPTLSEVLGEAAMNVAGQSINF
jgi:dihydrolipoamide dehydrogenase